MPNDERPPIRSPQFSNIKGPILTDARIRKYILEGRYGPEKQRALRESERAAKRRHNARRVQPVAEKVFLARALALLDDAS